MSLPTFKRIYSRSFVDHAIYLQPPGKLSPCSKFTVVAAGFICHRPPGSSAVEFNSE